MQCVAALRCMPVFLFIITLNDPAGSRQLGSASRPRHINERRRATSDQDELRKQGSGRPQAGGERCLRSPNSPLGRRCAGENHVFVRLAWIPISVCCTTLIFVGWEWRITCKLLRGPSTIHMHRVIVMSPPTQNPLPAACHGVRSRPLREFERCVLGDSQKFGPRRHSRRHL